MPRIKRHYAHKTDMDDAVTRTRRLVEAFVAERPSRVTSLKFSSDGRTAIATGRGFKGSNKFNRRMHSRG